MYRFFREVQGTSYPGTKKLISDFEKLSWNQGLQAQHDRSVAGLMDLYEAMYDLADRIEEQEAFVKLLAQLLKPPL